MMHQMPEMIAADKPRLIVVGSVTGNDNTVGGGGVYPVADLRELQGMAKVRILYTTHIYIFLYICTPAYIH